MSINHDLVNSTYDEIQTAIAAIETIVMRAHNFNEVEREALADYLYEISQDGSPVAQEIVTTVAENINI